MKNINETKTVNNTNEGDITMKNFKGFVIKTREQFDKIAHDVFGARQGKGYNTFLIKVDKGVKNRNQKQYDILDFNVEILAQPWNKATPHINIQKAFVIDKILPMTEDKKNVRATLIERFTFDELHVQCITPEAAEVLFLNYKRILIKGQGKNMLICLEDKWGKIIDICKKCIANISSNAILEHILIDKLVPRGIFYNQDGTLKDDVLKYGLGADDFGYQVSSKSAIKKKDILIYESSNPEKTKNRLNLVCNGVYDQLLNSNSSKTYLTIEEITKLAGRLALYMPPAGLVDPEQYHLKCVAVYTNKYKDDTGNEYMDGMHWGAAESLADACNMVCPDKYKVLPGACVGVHAQDRPYTANKSMVEFMYRKELSMHLQNTIKMTGEEPIILIRGKVTKKQQQAFNEALISKKGPYKNRVIIIADPDVKDPIEEIDSLSDINALKTSWDLNTKTNWHILKFVHLKHGHNNANISEQLLDCLFMSDYDRATNFMKNLLDEKLREIIEQVKTDQTNYYSNTELNGSLNLPDKLMSIAPDYIRNKNKSLYRSWANTKMESAVKMVKTLKIAVLGQYLTVCSDKATKWHNKKILGIKIDENGMPYIEVVCKAAEKEAIKRLIAIKYPKMGPKEFLKCRVLTVKEYCDRVEKSDLTDIEKEYLKKDVLLMSDGMIMIPSIEILKKQAAGLDFDIDSTSCFFEKELVDILWNTPMLAVNIDDSDSDYDSSDESKINQVEHIEDNGHKKFLLGSNAGLLSYYSYCSNSNKSVGEVTIMNSIFIQLFHMLGKQATAIEKKFSQQAFCSIFANKELSAMELEDPKLLGREEGVGIRKFVKVDDSICYGIPVHTVTNEFCNQLINGCRCMSYGKDYIPEALLLLTDIERYYQELTIDAAGNGKNITIAYNANDFVKLKSRESEFDVIINWEGKRTSFDGYAVSDDYFCKFDAGQTCRKTTKYYDYEEKAIKTKFIFELKDTTQKLREYALPKLYEIASLLKSYKQETCTELIDKYNSLLNDKKYIAIKDALYSFRLIYNIISGNKKEEMKLIGKDDEDGKKYISKKYKPFFEGMSNNVRTLLKDFSLEEKVLLMQYTSDRKMKEGIIIVEEANSSFVHNMIPEEFLMYITKEFGENRITVDPILYHKNIKEGDIIDFVDGVCINDGKTAVVKANINGEFVIGFKGKTAYAIKSIESSMIIPEITNERLVMTSEHNLSIKHVNDDKINNYLLTGQTVNLINANIITDKRSHLAKCKAGTSLEEKLLYDGIKGKIKTFITCKSSHNNKVNNVGVFIVENIVKNAVENTVKNIVEDVTKEVVKDKPKLKKIIKDNLNDLNSKKEEDNKPLLTKRLFKLDNLNKESSVKKEVKSSLKETIKLSLGNLDNKKIVKDNLDEECDTSKFVHSSSLKERLKKLGTL